MQDIFQFLKEENVSGFRDCIRAEIERRFSEASEGLYKDVVESMGLKFAETIDEAKDMKPEDETDEPTEDEKEKDQKKEIKAVTEDSDEDEDSEDEDSEDDEDDEDSDEDDDTDSDEDKKKVLTEK